MANTQRQRRVADQIQRELASIIRGELKDPRVALVTLTEVELSPDLAHAKVYYTTLVEGSPREETARALSHAAGFLRSQLGRRIHLHVTPELHFQYDTSIERGLALDRLIDEAVDTNKQDRGPA
jgi:ribosome-binding factor A